MAAAAARERSSKPSEFKLMYDLDTIDKDMSKYFGKVVVTQTRPMKYALRLRSNVVSALYESGLADVGSHHEKHGSHFFSKTIDGLEFSYSIEPYLTVRKEWYKPNGVVIMMFPAEQKVGKTKRYINFYEGEADTLFRGIVDAVLRSQISVTKSRARTLRSISTVSRGIRSAPTTPATTVFSIPGIVNLMGELSSPTVAKNNTKFTQTMRQLKREHNLSRANYVKIMSKIASESE